VTAFYRRRVFFLLVWHWFAVAWAFWSFVATPCCGASVHRLGCLYLGFTSGRVGMRGSKEDLVALANRPAELALA